MTGVSLFELLIIVAVWLVPIGISVAAVAQKGRPLWLGLVLGVFASWLGVIVACLISPTALQRARDQAQIDAYRQSWQEAEK